MQKEMEGDDAVLGEVDLTLYMSLSINTPLSKKKKGKVDILCYHANKVTAGCRGVIKRND